MNIAYDKRCSHVVYIDLSLTTFAGLGLGLTFVPPCIAMVIMLLIHRASGAKRVSDISMRMILKRSAASWDIGLGDDTSVSAREGFLIIGPRHLPLFTIGITGDDGSFPQQGL